jgi:alpha-acetolactate decarboxylase
VFENLNSELILFNNKTFVLKNKGFDINNVKGFGDDTVSYGKYTKYKNKSYYLYSSPDILSSNLNIIVKEEKHIQQDNTFTIILQSPFNEQKKQYFNWLDKAYYYIVDFQFEENKMSKD